MYRNVYDNWERLMGAVLKREELRQLALAHSRESSISSFSSSFNFGSDSPIQERSIQAGASSSEVNEDVTSPATVATPSSTRPSNSTPAALKNFTFADLQKATKNFSSDLVVGLGGFGTVYKGWVDSKKLEPSKAGKGMAVAVKKLSHKRFLGNEVLQLSEVWQAEVNFLGKLSHPNLIKLLGYCFEDDNKLLLVFEFMQRGSLENHLFRRSIANEHLSWGVRLRIAIEAARGLAFLHTSDKPVIHRNFTASCILLDGNYSAKISGFGLAKLGPSEEDSHVTTRVMGTSGYGAPEYVAMGHLYVKSDVYNFGAVLLQMLTGLRFLDATRPTAQHNLVEYAKPFLCEKRKLMSIIDARMQGQYSLEAAFQAGQLTLKCLEPDPRKRPSMEQVVKTLEKIAAIQHPKETKTKSMHSSFHAFSETLEWALEVEDNTSNANLEF